MTLDDEMQTVSSFALRSEETSEAR